MAITWAEFVKAFQVGSDTGDISQLSDMLTDDFQWITSSMDRDATLSWTSDTKFRINGMAETFYENADIISGTHPVLDEAGAQNIVMGIARLRDGKIYRYDHMRTRVDVAADN